MSLSHHFSAEGPTGPSEPQVLRLHPVTGPGPGLPPHGGGRPPLDLRDYLRILRDHRAQIAVTVLIAIAAAVALGLLPARKWTAGAMVDVEPSSALTGGTVRPDDVTYVDRQINTYKGMVESPGFAAAVRAKAGLRATPQLSVNAPANTNFIEITATTTSPQGAQRASDTAANELVRQESVIARSQLDDLQRQFDARSSQLEDGLAQDNLQLQALQAKPRPSAVDRADMARLREQISGERISINALRNDFELKRSSQEARTSALSVTGQARLPLQPENRNLKLLIWVGLMLGLLTGIAAAFFSEALRGRLHTRAEFESSVEAPVLATLPRVGRKERGRIFTAGTDAEEGVRRLRTALLRPGVSAPRTLMITSAQPGEGKSTIAANLAVSVAATGRRVLLVDADLRRPAAHGYFGLEVAPGLSNILQADNGETPERLERPAGHERLFVLPAGSPVQDTAALLARPRMRELITRMRNEFDLVIFDTPAILAVSDGFEIAGLLDQVVMVANADVDSDVLQAADAELKRVGAEPVGLVVNGARDLRSHHYQSYEGRTA